MMTIEGTDRQIENVFERVDRGTAKEEQSRTYGMWQIRQIGSFDPSAIPL